MTGKIKRVFATAVILILFAFLTYLRFTNPDMTNMRFVITFWPDWLLWFIGTWAAYWLYAVQIPKKG